MRVGFYLPDFSGGGNERAAVMYARHWPAEAERPTFLVRAVTGPFLEQAAANCDVVGLDMAARSLRASLSTPSRLGAEVKSRRIDALVGFLSLPSLVAAKAWARETRLVWSVQTACLRPTSSPGESRSQVVRQGFQSLVLRAALYGVDGIHVPTEGLVDGLGLQAYDKPIAFVPNGIEPALLDAAPLARRGSGTPRIVSVGRLVPSKRFDLLIEAVRRVVAVRPVELAVYGVGPQRHVLEQQARAAGLETVVRFGGFENDLARVYGGADVFVLASDHEAFGNVVIEALAFGLPAVVTDAPFGPAEILDHGRYGLVVERGRADLLADAILRALPGGADHDRLSRSAAARAASYAAPLMARRLYDFLTAMR